MTKGQKARITVKPEYGFKDVSTSQPLAEVPPNSTLIYDVELVSFENSKESWSMSADEKITACQELKDAGNALFKAGKNDRALKRYKKAVELVEYDSNFSDDQKASAKTVKKTCWLNQAAVQLKMKRWLSSVLSTMTTHKHFLCMVVILLCIAALRTHVLHAPKFWIWSMTM